jgi:hypothetical protein
VLVLLVVEVVVAGKEEDGVPGLENTFITRFIILCVVVRGMGVGSVHRQNSSHSHRLTHHHLRPAASPRKATVVVFLADQAVLAGKEMGRVPGVENGEYNTAIAIQL